MSPTELSAPTLPVLVLDGDQSSSLAIVRALGRRGVRVHVASHVTDSIAGYSRHAQARLLYPDPLHDGDAFVGWLAEMLSHHPYALTIPVTERTLVPIHRNRHRLPTDRLAIAPQEALEQALDKELTVGLADRLGIPVPRSLTVHSVDEALRTAASFVYPVVVKPSRSVGTAGASRVQLSVTYALNVDQLARQVGHALRHGGVILQEYFRGEGVGVELIADRGSVRYVFQHRRLHEVPLTGGGSSLRVSEPVTPHLRQAAETLMAALGWHGVAMVEFKHASATGDYRLVEINGRFWGSLPLAVAAGADFPCMLYELMTEGRVGEVPPARSGIVCRNLARDLDWLEHVLRRAAPVGIASLPTTGRVVRDTLMVFSSRHRFDVQSLQDLRPGWVDMVRIARRQWQRVAAAVARQHHLFAQRRAARSGGAGEQRLRKAGQVLFLCYGNINRSAIAQAHAQARYGDIVKFESAGFHTDDNRPADPTMVEVAARTGMDLSRWRSRTLTPEMVHASDLILAMELDHLERLRARFPEARGKAFLLGARKAGIRTQAEIADPYGQSPSRYEQIFGEVTAAVDAWMLARRSVAPKSPGGR